MKPGSLPSGHWWLPVSPVVSLEGQLCGALGGGSLEGGVCDSFSHASPSFSDSYRPGFVLSPVCQGEGFGRGDSGSSPQGSGGACAPDSGLLQLHVCCDQGYGGLEADHRPLNSEPECGSDSVSDGDISDGPACCPQERLDGLHRSEGCVPSDPDPPCVLQVSQVHSRREDLAVTGPLLRSVHGSAGVHSCDGTCVRVPPSAGNPDAPVSGRLADSRVIQGGSLLGKGQGSQPLSGAGNCCQPREVDSHSISVHCLLGNQGRLADFPGFGDSLEDRKVLLNSRRISVLKGAVCEVLESLARPPRLSVSPCSEWPASNESSSIGSKSRLGFSGRGYPGSLGSSFSGRPSVVVHRGSSRRGDHSSPALSRPNVLVRRLQPRLGGHCRRPVRFRRLVGGRGLSLDQPTRVVGRRERPQGSLFLLGRSGCRSLLRQHDRGGVSEEARRDLVSGLERGSPAHSALGGAVEHHPDASVCSREEQCGGGRPVSPRPGSRLGVDAPSGCVQLAPPALAGDNRSVCVLTQSPLFCLFCACVGSHGCGYRCHAPVMGFATVVCLPSLRHDQPGLGEGEGLSESGADTHRFILAPASVVSGAADSAPSSSSISMGSSASATRQDISSKPVHASSSCVETLRRFARASGYFRSVARRLGQARRQSSVANYQSKWLTYRRWCTDKGHSVSQPSVSKVADFLVWL